MDSLTQATLGAAVGHLFWQAKLGRKALVAGALLGTLPDLDVLVFPFLDNVQQLYWHRGESHSVWFIVLGSIGFGWLLKRLSATKQLSIYEASIGVLLIFSTHVFIDLFNVYGTQLLAPVSRQGFAFNNMFIIDPLFSIPLIIGTAGAFFLGRKSSAVWLNQSCLVLASLYVVWSLCLQSVADRKFRSALMEQEVDISRQLTSAGSFTTLLWRHIAETPDGFLLAYWSLLDDAGKPIRFLFIPRNDSIIRQIKTTRTFKTVNWFSQGWWFVAKSDSETATVVDLRFAEIPSAEDQSFDQWDWPFAWQFFLNEKKETRLKAIRPELKDPAMTLRLISRRINGQGQWLATSPGLYGQL